MFQNKGDEKYFKKFNASCTIVLNTLKHLGQKKRELSKFNRKEIANLIKDKKYEKARIKVELAISDDYLIECMEMVEVYCETVKARIMNFFNDDIVDEGLLRPLHSIIYSEKYLKNCSMELQTIVHVVSKKKGLVFVENARNNRFGYVSPKLVKKLSVKIPPVRLVEGYLLKIAQCFNFPYTIDQEAIDEDEVKRSRLILDDEVTSFKHGNTPVLSPNVLNKSFDPSLKSGAPPSYAGEVSFTETFDTKSTNENMDEPILYTAASSSNISSSDKAPPNYKKTGSSNDDQLINFEDLDNTKFKLSNSRNSFNSKLPNSSSNLGPSKPTNDDSKIRHSSKKTDRSDSYSPTADDLSIEERLARLKRS
ncbi:Increased sodium tolerance protein 1 [Intoshia linei]|uniref:IST1 homolog n=1 Tax=Intoshia linei TaxID=1819745 RepID=A0A177AWT4_9BILA|nr:Increased sodium tolerance protein 1 [Intoshia linei]